MFRSLVLLAALPFSAFAQNSSIPEVNLTPVVVTATRDSQTLDNALPHTTVLNSAAIRNAMAVDLPSLLRSESGLQIVRNGGLGAPTGLFLRGSNSAQVLVLLDGIPLNKQDATGTVSLEHIALEHLERIEIVRGNVSSLYGSGAIGGVVQLFTKAAAVSGEKTSGVYGTAGMTLGSYGRKEANASLNGNAGSLAYGLTVSKVRANGFSGLNPQQIPAANPDKDGYKNTTASAYLRHQINTEHALGVRALFTRGNYDYDSAFGAPADLHAGKMTYRQLAINSENQLTSAWKSNLVLANSREGSETANGGAFAYNDSYTTNVKLLQWNNKFSLNKASALNLGIERQSQHLDADDGFGGVFSLSRQTRAVYGGAQFRNNGVSAQVNLRHDSTQGAPQDIKKTTGLLALGYEFNPQWQMSAMTSTGFNAPSLGYLYSPAFGNPLLKPENSRGAELGLQFKSKAALINWRLFTTRIRNEFAFDFVTYTLANLNSTKNVGLETSASGRLAAAQGLTWRASLTLQNAKDANTNQALTRRPHWLGNLGVTQQLGQWNFGADVHMTGRRIDTAAATPGTYLSAYGVVDLRAQYRVSTNLAVVAKLENLADKNYQTAWGYNAPGRSISLGLRYHSR